MLDSFKVPFRTDHHTGNRPLRQIQVVAAIISNDQQEVFITQRPEGKRLSGLWEFPGGKVEPGEARYDALCRECYEELGIEIQQASLFDEAIDQTDSGCIQLSFWWVEKYRYKPFGREGQRAEWVAVSALSDREFPRANGQILQALGKACGVV